MTQKQKDGVFFLDAPTGTEKTRFYFEIKLLFAKVCLDGCIRSAVASSEKTAIILIVVEQFILHSGFPGI